MAAFDNDLAEMEALEYVAEAGYQIANLIHGENGAFDTDSRAPRLPDSCDNLRSAIGNHSGEPLLLRP